MPCWQYLLLVITIDPLITENMCELKTPHQKEAFMPAKGVIVGVSG